MEGDSNKAIFNVICEQLTRAEYKDAQYSYLTKHASKFDDTEENKLEYTTVHEGYIYLLESVIDTKLQESFSDEQVQTFYIHFKDNFKSYEQENLEAV